VTPTEALTRLNAAARDDAALAAGSPAAWVVVALVGVQFYHRFCSVL
jgi:hypothetical protein